MNFKDELKNVLRDDLHGANRGTPFTGPMFASIETCSPLSLRHWRCMNMTVYYRNE